MTVELIYERVVPGGLPGRRLFRNVNLSDEYAQDQREPATLDDAQVVSSLLTDHRGEMHAPVLDLDFGATLVPSSTRGHFHLYLDHPMPWAKYADLLMALGDAGILEPGYVRASLARRHTAVRLPWVRKDEPSGVPAVCDDPWAVGTVQDVF